MQDKPKVNTQRYEEKLGNLVYIYTTRNGRIVAVRVIPKNEKE